MLELKNVSKTFNPGTINAKTALSGLNLRLNDGDFVTVIGGNGAGKSTMLNAIAGAFEIDGGSISIDGVDITRQSEHKRAAMIGRVFQDPMLGTAPTMTIEENLALAARRGRRRTLAWGIKRTERSHYRDQLARLGLGLEDRMTSARVSSPADSARRSRCSWPRWSSPGCCCSTSTRQRSTPAPRRACWSSATRSSPRDA